MGAQPEGYATQGQSQWHGLQAVRSRAGIDKPIRPSITAGSPDPSLSSRAILPSMSVRVEEMHVEILIPTPDPTETASM